jgi:hypothetical protein
MRREDRRRGRLRAAVSLQFDLWAPSLDLCFAMSSVLPPEPMRPRANRIVPIPNVEIGSDARARESFVCGMKVQANK